MQCDFTHHGEARRPRLRDDRHRPTRIVNAVPAVVASPGGLVTALDLPLVTGGGLVSKA